MFIVVGLGNPDKKYQNNLHNLGFTAIDLLAEKLGVSIDKKGYKGLYALTTIKGEKVMLLKPQTYLNLSGESVVSAVSFFKVPLENVLVIYDDIDVEIGKIRIRKSGSAGTHNGMRNIVTHLSSTNFPRIRVGCKPQNFKGDLVEYVLSNVESEDKPFFDDALSKAVNASNAFINGEKLDTIMNRFNG